jgi:hypothetical protein
LQKLCRTRGEVCVPLHPSPALQYEPFYHKTTTVVIDLAHMRERPHQFIGTSLAWFVATWLHLQRPVRWILSPCILFPCFHFPHITHHTLLCDQIVRVRASSILTRNFHAFDVPDGLWHCLSEKPHTITHGVDTKGGITKCERTERLRAGIMGIADGTAHRPRHVCIPR